MLSVTLIQILITTLNSKTKMPLCEGAEATRYEANETQEHTQRRAHADMAVHHRHDPTDSAMVLRCKIICLLAVLQRDNTLLFP